VGRDFDDEVSVQGCADSFQQRDRRDDPAGFEARVSAACQFDLGQSRFRIIEGSPEPAEWLEVFETDNPDPLHAYPRVTSHTLPASQIQPQLTQSFRLAGTRKTNGA
jgi:hypothetical protein